MVLGRQKRIPTAIILALCLATLSTAAPASAEDPRVPEPFDYDFVAYGSAMVGEWGEYWEFQPANCSGYPAFDCSHGEVKQDVPKGTCWDDYAGENGSGWWRIDFDHWHLDGAAPSVTLGRLDLEISNFRWELVGGFTFVIHGDWVDPATGAEGQVSGLLQNSLNFQGCTALGSGPIRFMRTG